MTKISCIIFFLKYPTLFWTGFNIFCLGHICSKILGEAVTLKGTSGFYVYRYESNSPTSPLSNIILQDNWHRNLYVYIFIQVKAKSINLNIFSRVNGVATFEVLNMNHLLPMSPVPKKIYIKANKISSNFYTLRFTSNSSF